MKPPRVYAIDGVVPVIDPSAYVHPSAVLIGDVIVGPGCYVGPCASLRGDFGRLILKAGVNVQDTCVIHSFPDHDTVVNENGHIGHGAVLHCCTIGRNALVGMNAVVMDNAVVGENAFVAACSFVKAGMQVPPGTLVAGTPAKVVRPLTEQEMAWKVQGTGIYQNLTRRCLATMVETDALAAVEADRKRIVMPEIIPLSEQKQRS
ncbi:transferase hexapeptide repeat family protein [Aromatoleum buckelii]|uniref:Phenylacetic acid degradation protein PaaY n=1 Tax=Aromatoleum buckelii TaxID=200254 RepID=A0ABX1N568_9RHOO|nr:transferase hexapeptide repeat family protein [Aromatoleum buckelii]MCK0511738.1 transferase hexapeptide repeat family protein [Aromatoleum buckelii]